MKLNQRRCFEYSTRARNLNFDQQREENSLGGGSFAHIFAHERKHRQPGRWKSNEQGIGSFSLDFTRPTRMFKYKNKGGENTATKEHATYPSIALLIIRLWRCTRASLYLFPFLSFPYIFLLFPLSVSPPPPKGQDTFDATNNKFECVNLGNWYATGKNFNDRVVNNKINWIIL